MSCEKHSKLVNGRQQSGKEKKNLKLAMTWRIFICPVAKGYSDTQYKKQCETFFLFFFKSAAPDFAVKKRKRFFFYKRLLRQIRRDECQEKRRQRPPCSLPPLGPLDVDRFDAPIKRSDTHAQQNK